MTKKPLTSSSKLAAQIWTYHVDGVRSYVLHDYGRDQWDPPFCFGIVWKFSAGKTKGLWLSIRPLILKQCVTETAEHCVCVTRPRNRGTLLVSEAGESYSCLSTRLLCDAYLTQPEKSRVVVECKPAGVLRSVRVEGWKALSIMFIWNCSPEAAPSIHQTSRSARKAPGLWNMHTLPHGSHERCFFFCFENKSTALYVCSIFALISRHTSQKTTNPPWSLKTY